MSFEQRLNAALDSLATPRFAVGHRSASAFWICGCTGLCAAILIGAALTRHLNLSLTVLLAVSAAALATFLALAMITKIIQGREELVYYRHEVAILCMAASLLLVFEQPLLPFLEITILGVGAFLACGRIGCFMVGCCHGRPHDLGVRYRIEHARAGFSATLVGIRLFPVQLVEAVSVAIVVAIGMHLVWRGAAAGETLALYSIVYGVVRFLLEFARGDGVRRYLGSFSEAQWTTALLMSATVAAESSGLLPLRWWHVAVTLALVSFMVAWSVTDHARRRIFSPTHVEEIVALFRSARSCSREYGNLQIGVTRLGLRLSSCTIPSPSNSSWLDTVAFSATPEMLDLRAARGIARLLSLVDGREGELVVGNSGVYHLVLSTASGTHEECAPRARARVHTGVGNAVIGDTVSASDLHRSKEAEDAV